MSESQKARFDIAGRIADIGLKVIMSACAFFASFVFYSFNKTQQVMQETQSKMQENMFDIKTAAEVLNVKVNGLEKDVDEIKSDIKDLSRKDGNN